MFDPKSGKNLSERELRALSTDEFLALLQQDIKDLDRTWKERRRAAGTGQPQPLTPAPPEPEKPARPVPPPKPGALVQSTLPTEGSPPVPVPAVPAPKRRRGRNPAGPPARPLGDSLATLLEEARAEMPPEDLDLFHSVNCCDMHLGDFPPIARVCCPFCGEWHRAGDHPLASASTR